jgi:hypothetical protein
MEQGSAPAEYENENLGKERPREIPDKEGAMQARTCLIRDMKKHREGATQCLSKKERTSAGSLFPSIAPISLEEGATRPRTCLIRRSTNQ